MISHAGAGEPIDVRPYGAALGAMPTHALFKSGELEAIRVVLRAGAGYALHHVPGDVVLQCLEGRVRFADDAGDGGRILEPGHLVYWRADRLRPLTALEDASLLLILRINAHDPADSRTVPV